MNISRHDVDIDKLNSLYSQVIETFNRSFDLIPKNPSAMNVFADVARNTFVLTSTVDPEPHQLLERAKVAAQAAHAVFALASADGRPCAIQLGERHYTFQTNIHDGYLHFGAWSDAFYLSIVANEQELTNSLCQFPFERLKQSSVVVPVYTEWEALILRTYWTGEKVPDDLFTKLLTFEETGRLAKKNKEWRQYIGIPVYRLWLSLICGENNFSELLFEALTSHKKYWSSKKRDDIVSGLLPVALVALNCLAFERKISVSVTSDYIPQSLIELHRHTGKK